MKLLIGASAFAVVGYLLTSTSPVHASPVRSASAISTSGHEVRPEFIDSSYTHVQLLASAIVGGVAGAYIACIDGAVTGAAAGGAAYLVSHLDVLSHTDRTLENLPPGVDARHIAELSDARLDAPSSKNQ